MTFKHSIKKYSPIETALIVLLLLLIFSLTSPLTANAQDGEFGVALTHEDGLDQPALDANQPGDTGVMAKTRALRKLLFSFLASTTGLSSLFWLVARGGWGL